MSIFTKFFESIKKWFRPNRALPAPTTINEEVSKNDLLNSSTIDNTETNATDVVASSVSSAPVERIEFVNNLKIQKQEEDPELLELQKKFESNQIELSKLTDVELDSLNDLYQRQIDELKEKLNKTKSEININMNKLESSVASA